MDYKDGNTKHFSKKVCERGSRILKIHDYTEKRYSYDYMDKPNNTENKDNTKNYIRKILNHKIFC